MIHLRQLNRDDAPLMLEWMHDADIQKCFQKDMMGMTLEKAQGFCENAVIPETPVQGESIHYAIADEADEYLGTISLKDIDLKNKTAEYAVCLRKKAQGKAIGREATHKVLQVAFGELRLNRVYLNVLSDNDKAQKMYKSCGFKYEGTFKQHIFKDGKYVDIDWYGILAADYM